MWHVQLVGICILILAEALFVQYCCPSVETDGNEMENNALLFHLQAKLD